MVEIETQTKEVRDSESPQKSSSWGAFSAFGNGKDAHGQTNKSFFFTVVILVLIFSGLGGYYTYSTVSGATFFGKTLTTNINLENGLVGHWTFDGPDMTTATATDRSGNGNDGFLLSDPKRVSGKVGQGLYFDSLITGVDQEVNTGSPVVLDDINTLTISMWARHEFISYNLQEATIISKMASCISETSGWRLYNAGFGNVQYAFTRSFSSVKGKWIINTSLNKDAWHHIVVTYDKSSSANDPKFYVNGVEIAITEDSTPSGTPTTDASQTLTIGNCSVHSRGRFDGSLDDVRIYNRALSAKEVEALYKVGEGSKISVTPLSSSRLQNGLVGHWTFDGGDMTDATALDASGHGNDSTLANAPKRVIGKTGQALSFTNGSNQFLINTPTEISSLNQFTLTAWVKPVSYGQGNAGAILSNGVSSNWDLNIGNGSTGKLRFKSEFFSPGIWDSDTTISLNEWQHVVVSYDTTSVNNNPIFYINGILSNSTEVATPASFYIKNTSNAFFVGNNAGASKDFDGVIDDVRIYNRALSVDEVKELYALGGGTTIKICRESSVLDADGNSYNTLAIGSQCWLDRNMDVGTRIAVATAQTDNGTIEKYCYNNNSLSCTFNNPNKPGGGLYQWGEAMQYNPTEGARGICPAGFHIPADSEWSTLEKFVNNVGEARSVGTSGTRLKPNGSSGFEGNLSGDIVSGISFNQGSFGLWWSSSLSGSDVWLRYVYSVQSQVSRSTYSQSYGLSVRCLQD